MNIDNVKWFQSHGTDWVVADGDGLPRLFCNGRIICLADNLAVGGEAERMIPVMQKMWRENPTALVMTPDQLCGTELGAIARRFKLNDSLMAPGKVYVYCDERYVHCFSRDAVFCGTDPFEPVIVMEDGKLAGIIMPMRFEQAEPWGRNVPDSIIFHRCPDEEYE